MQGKCYGITIFQMFVNVFYLSGKYMRHCIFDSGWNINDCFIRSLWLPYIKYCVADFHGIVHFSSRKTFLQVLTQAREHIIKKTFEAVKGAPHAVIHLYNSTSVAQREQVFKKSKEEVKQIAIDGAKLLNKLASETEGNFS